MFERDKYPQYDEADEAEFVDVLSVTSEAAFAFHQYVKNHEDYPQLREALANDMYSKDIFMAEAVEKIVDGCVVKRLEEAFRFGATVAHRLLVFDEAANDEAASDEAASEGYIPLLEHDEAAYESFRHQFVLYVFQHPDRYFEERVQCLSQEMDSLLDHVDSFLESYDQLENEDQHRAALYGCVLVHDLLVQQTFLNDM